MAWDFMETNVHLELIMRMDNVTAALVVLMEIQMILHQNYNANIAQLVLIVIKWVEEELRIAYHAQLAHMEF
eukprot:CAMPEP_0117781472 /NCGR_PEP_ID=MMETSP0948-20121206/2859_1 /TAXON_ID=44440 /ORGANISM="Chattonella subsalsa, Strain CCMP2191" /LENGTH=71 /DNA_ID=CAMNT_0005609495 /DNA_START=96 /DNA_END=311 /DNA_ORIENTATION=-